MQTNISSLCQFKVYVFDKKVDRNTIDLSHALSIHRFSCLSNSFSFYNSIKERRIDTSPVINFMYLDDENDWIKVHVEEDFAEMMRVMKFSLLKVAYSISSALDERDIPQTQYDIPSRETSSGRVYVKRTIPKFLDDHQQIVGGEEQTLKPIKKIGKEVSDRKPKVNEALQVENGRKMLQGLHRYKSFTQKIKMEKDRELEKVLETQTGLSDTNDNSSQVLPIPEEAIEKTETKDSEETEETPNMSIKCQLLKKMGFSDQVRNSELLEKHQNNIQNVIEELLEY